MARVISVTEFEKRKLAQKSFDMVKVPEFKEKWGEKWQQRYCKFYRKFSNYQGHIQSSAWDSLVLGKR